MRMGYSVPITNLSIDDIEAVCKEHDIPQHIIDEHFSNEEDVNALARKMEDAYIDNLFWDSLWALIEDEIKDSRRGG